MTSKLLVSLRLVPILAVLLLSGAAGAEAGDRFDRDDYVLVDGLWRPTVTLDRAVAADDDVHAGTVDLGTVDGEAALGPSEFNPSADEDDDEDDKDDKDGDETDGT